MGRPALAATRAVEILTLLAARPNQALTLTEIAGHLDLSLASCHALMRVLEDAGYVSRHPVTRSYDLGPALVALGHAALEHHRAIDLARDEVRRLAEELGIEAVASAPIGRDLIVLARAGRPRSLDLLPRIGQRLPLSPPIGAVFVAWENPAAAADWIDRASPTAADRAELERLLQQIRTDGFEIALQTPTRDRIADVLTELATSPHSQEPRDTLPGLIGALLHEQHHPDAIDDDEVYDVNYCMAPVFDARGRVVLALTVLGFPPKLSGADLRARADQLRRRARVVTTSTDGQTPR